MYLTVKCVFYLKMHPSGFGSLLGSLELERSAGPLAGLRGRMMWYRRGREGRKWKGKGDEGEGMGVNCEKMKSPHCEFLRSLLCWLVAQ